jgi:predicted amidohydrolase YtcJ
MCLACNGALAAILEVSASRRDFFKFAAGASALSAFTISGADKVRAQPADGPADIIFRGGPILTMSDRAPRAEALAVRGERILAVGRLQDVEARRGPRTRVVDLDGRTLLPGLIDPHMHFVFVQFDDWIDVSAIGTPSYGGVMAKLHEGVRTARPGAWVRAQGFDPSITQGAHDPTLAELDALASDHPFFMLESNGHVAYANSQALQIAEITRDTPDPPAGRFMRDANGALTGRVEEPPALRPFLRKMPLPGAAEVRDRVRRLFERAAARGCTALHDCGVGLHAATADLALLGAALQDQPPVRYRGMLVSLEMERWEAAGVRPGHGNDLFRVDGMKAWVDGSNQAYTGYQRADYLGRATRGSENYALPQLTEVMRRAHRAGWQIGVHANGDAAIDTSIAAYETVLREMPRADHRHRIEHCSVLHRDQIARMRALGLSPSFLIGHVRWWGKAFRDRILGPERAALYDPCASALKAGLRISLHSDWNVTPIDPLRCVEDAVARVMHEGGEVLAPDERIPVEAALRAVTIDAAWQCRMDDIVGSLEPGKYADLALLERDPTTVGPTEISRIKVSETWLAGERRHAG